MWKLIKQDMSLKKTNCVGFKKKKKITQGEIHESYTNDKKT